MLIPVEEVYTMQCNFDILYMRDLRAVIDYVRCGYAKVKKETKGRRERKMNESFQSNMM